VAARLRNVFGVARTVDSLRWHLSDVAAQLEGKGSVADLSPTSCDIGVGFARRGHPGSFVISRERQDLRVSPAPEVFVVCEAHAACLDLNEDFPCARRSQVDLSLIEDISTLPTNASPRPGTRFIRYLRSTSGLHVTHSAFHGSYLA
jgi:hypothetical protein